MKISRMKFIELVEESKNYTDAESFASDAAMSQYFDYDAEQEDQIISENYELCLEIYKISRLTIKDIRSKLGLSQVKFSKAFGVPLRTVEDWESKDRAALYIVLLFAEIAGFINFVE